MTMQIGLDTSSLGGLVRSLDAFSDYVKAKVTRNAIKRGAKVFRDSIASLIPRNPKKTPGRMHYKDGVTWAIKNYDKMSRVVAIIGPPSKSAPHAHLVERGTRQRFTNSKPKYKRMAVGLKWKIVKGQAVQKIERQRKSIGSVIKHKGRPRLNRGRMPAFHPVQHGVDAARSDAIVAMSAELTAGMNQAAAVSRVARGKA